MHQMGPLKVFLNQLLDNLLAAMKMRHWGRNDLQRFENTSTRTWEAEIVQARKCMQIKAFALYMEMILQVKNQPVCKNA